MIKNVTIVCDGSSLGNGSERARAGAAAVLIHTDREGKQHHRVVAEYLGKATNNQAEIVAVAIGLEALKTPCNVEVITDSRYVVETQRGAFREKKNFDFWKRLRDARAPHNVKWTWTRGHDRHPVQELCDRAARNVALRGSVDPKIIDQTLRLAIETGWSPNGQ